jgi:hypothetical protein
MITKKIKGDGPVHGSTVHIDIIQLFGQLFCQCAFSTGRPTVDSNDNFFHALMPGKIAVYWCNCKKKPVLFDRLFISP